MKKYLPYAAIGLVIVIAAVVAFLVLKNNSDKDNQNSNVKSISLNFNETLCDQISAEVVGSAIGKDIIKSEPISSGTTNVCQYYVDATHFVTLRLNNLSYETQKQGQEALDRTISTNERIHLEHFVALQEDGLINDIVLKLGDNSFIAVDRSSGSTFSNENMLQLASDVSDYLIKGIKNTDESDSTANSNSQVSTLDDEQFIRNFFALINDKKASDAVLVMTSKNTSDDSVKQAWGVQFNYMDSVNVISLSANQQSTWTASFRQYKVVLDVVMSPNSANAPIPYYGYENGQNTRFINLVKEDNTWRVDGIATGA
jgi:hypothetical protein